jgi:protein-S-isoprenylcysteine O-methyltransferase Ste14
VEKVVSMMRFNQAFVVMLVTGSYANTNNDEWPLWIDFLHTLYFCAQLWLFLWAERKLNNWAESDHA